MLLASIGLSSSFFLGLLGKVGEGRGGESPDTFAFTISMSS
jgi:hypothetical protein